MCDIDKATVFIVGKPLNQHGTGILVRYRIFKPRDTVNSYKYAIVTTKKTTLSTQHNSPLQQQQLDRHVSKTT